MKILVVGSGGWGTALSLLLLENGHDVTLWSYFDKETETMHTTGENPYLPGVLLPDNLRLTSDISCAREADVLVIATPSFAVRETAKRLKPLLEKNTLIISVAKGIERESLLLMTQIIDQEIGSSFSISALSGPSHAEEVGRGVPTAVVSACTDIAVADRVQELFMNGRFRVYSSDDIIGVELGAALKNVIALSVGCCEGMGYGDNTRAMLMTRGLAEIARVGAVMGGKKETFAGLAGMGDLIVTCTSAHSRNHRAGLLIGSGMDVQEAMKQVGSVVEGYYAAASGVELSRHYGIDMPITEAIYNVLYKNSPISEVFTSLMNRSQKREIEESWI